MSLIFVFFPENLSLGIIKLCTLYWFQTSALTTEVHIAFLSLLLSANSKGLPPIIPLLIFILSINEEWPLQGLPLCQGLPRWKQIHDKFISTVFSKFAYECWRDCAMSFVPCLLFLSHPLELVTPWGEGAGTIWLILKNPDWYFFSYVIVLKYL